MSTSIARRLRKTLTRAEQHLWTRIRRRQLAGCLFRKQAPIGRYVVDFVCFTRKLIIEVDRGQHATRIAMDAKRTAWLESQGFLVIRFWNNEVLQSTDEVLENVLAALLERDALATRGPTSNGSRVPCTLPAKR